MREHMGLYRGKRKDNGEWVEGWLVIKKDPILDVTYCFILVYGKGESYVTWYPVDPDTVGECTGLRDKNGKLIFEGDIVRTQPFSDRPYSKRAKFKQHIGLVEHKIYPKYVSEWFVKVDDYKGYGCCNWSAFYDCEIIGNIHDNPELLKGGEGDGQEQRIDNQQFEGEWKL